MITHHRAQSVSLLALCCWLLSFSDAATEALATEAPAAKQSNAYDSLIGLLTNAVKNFYHAVCDPAAVEIQVSKMILNSRHLEKFDAIVLNQEAVAKHIHLHSRITTDKSGNAKELLFFEWCTNCIQVRNQVLASRPAAQLLHSTTASDHGCHGCDRGTMLTENETLHCYRLIHGEGGL